MKNNLPKIIKEIGFDFNWDIRKVWALDLPVVEMPVKELAWMFEIPFWDSYKTKPIDVANNPKGHKDQYKRTMATNLSHPLDIMFWKGRWLMLDGLHRLLKAHILGLKTVKVRKIPVSLISQIKSD